MYRVLQASFWRRPGQSYIDESILTFSPVVKHWIVELLRSVYKKKKNNSQGLLWCQWNNVPSKWWDSSNSVNWNRYQNSLDLSIVGNWRRTVHVSVLRNGFYELRIPWKMYSKAKKLFSSTVFEKNIQLINWSIAFSLNYLSLLELNSNA